MLNYDIAAIGTTVETTTGARLRRLMERIDSRKKRASRKRLLLTLALVCSMILTGTAMAEGYWNSYISGAGPGFNSRDWQDLHNDANSTNIQFQNCTETGNPYLTGMNATVDLWWVRSLLPDVFKGSQTLYCYHASPTAWYGEMTDSGWYHFTISKINGVNCCHQLDVEKVQVWY